MADQQMRDAFGALTHLYAAAAAHIRQDDFAVVFLRDNESSRRQLLQAAVTVTAQALSMAGDVFDPDLLSCLVSDHARAELLDAAQNQMLGDRLTGYETVERLSRVQRSVTDIAGPLLGELWSMAAFNREMSPNDFAQHLCLSAGVVGAALEG